jgi:hypothetical protein
VVQGGGPTSSQSILEVQLSLFGSAANLARPAMTRCFRD